LRREYGGEGKLSSRGREGVLRVRCFLSSRKRILSEKIKYREKRKEELFLSFPRKRVFLN